MPTYETRDYCGAPNPKDRQRNCVKRAGHVGKHRTMEGKQWAKTKAQQVMERIREDFAAGKHTVSFTHGAVATRQREGDGLSWSWYVWDKDARFHNTDTAMGSHVNMTTLLANPVWEYTVGDFGVDVDLPQAWYDARKTEMEGK